MRIRPVKSVVLSGFFVWLVPFVVSFLIFPLRTSQRPLFESVMPVVVTLCAVAFSVAFFSRSNENPLRQGMVLGVCWLLISIVLDLVLFMEGPMKMALPDYIMDIGVTYLIIPTVTIGVGYVLHARSLSPA